MAAYSGTKITGTSTTAKVFKNSGIKNARQGDTYKNTDTGHVYSCTRAGGPGDATWRYDHTNIVKKPSGKVTSHAALKRGSGYEYESKWKVPSSLTSLKNGRRATNLFVATGFAASDGNDEAYGEFSHTYGTGRTSISIDLGSSNVKIGGKSGRNAFYPRSQYKLMLIYVHVEATNSKGSGPWSEKTIVPAAPLAPTVNTPSVNTSTGVVSATIKPAESGSVRERLLTRWQVWKKDVGEDGAKEWIKNEGTSTSNSDFTVTSGDLTNWQDPNHHWVVAVRARSEGWGGDSAWTNWRYCGVGWPKVATIGAVEVPDPNDDTKYGYLNITSTNADTDYPVDQVVLQKLVNQPATTDGTMASEAEIAAANASQEWEDTDAVDNDKCAALAFLVGELRPSAGTRSYVRVKSWNDIEGLFASFSEPKDVWQLFDAGAVDNECKLYHGPGTGDSTSTNIIVAWDSKSSSDEDDTTSIELAWSEDSGAWKSNKVPEPFEFSWKDDTVAPEAAELWNKSATFKVKDLEPGETYFFQARCIVDDGDSRTEGEWCSQISSVPSTVPANAVLTAPAAVPRGSDIPFSWSFSGGTEQMAWELMEPNGLTGIIPRGSGPVQSASISAGDAEAHLTDGNLVAIVRIYTDGGTVDSEPVTVTITDPPSLAVGAISDLTAQPLTIPLECSTAGCSVAIVVSADGCTTYFPDGPRTQTAGDTVWTGTVQPEWSYDQSTGKYTADIELGEGLALWDGADYTVEAVATDAISGLPSSAASAGFSVELAHQAPSPSDSFEVDAEVTVDADGETARSAAIQLVPPESAASDDVYDVYRVTGDGAELIAEGVALNALVTDYYAPFGDATHFYRVVTRTADGDMAWRDVDYQLPGVGLRFDFDGDSYDYVELPWNVVQQDSYAKDFMLSKGMDGSMAGAWNPAVERTGSYETDVIKVVEQGNIDAIRDLAKHAGAVFVRTSAGLAFAANVQVDAIEIDGMSPAVAVSFSATEVDQDDRFKAALPIEDGD